MAHIGEALRKRLGSAMLEGDKLPAYAFPGGYPMYYLASDNGVLCPECANAFTPDRDNEDQLKAVACDINYEDLELFCEHCNKRIESAYAEPEEDRRMITIFQGEQRNGRIKFTTDRDSLAPDIIRFRERVFPDLAAVLAEAKALESRGFKVCIDTDALFYETPEKERRCPK